MIIVKKLLIIFTFIFFIYICLYLNCFNIRGKKIIKVKGKTVAMWYILFVLWSLFFIFNLIELLKQGDYYNRDYYNLNYHNIDRNNFSYWIIFSLSNILGAKVSNTITEKGIYIDSAFYSWKKIESYRWVDENTLEFRIRRIKKYKNKRLEVDLDINRTEVDMILKGFIKENREAMY